MKHPVNWPLQHDGQAYQAGELIELSETDAAPLMAAGVIGKPVKTEPKTKPEPKAAK